MAEDKDETIRIDKWLWYTRQVKTRNLGSQLVNRGVFRVNEQPVRKASFNVKPGDVVSGMIHDSLRILKVIEIGSRRGPYQEALTLYEDLSPPVEPDFFYAPAQQHRPRRSVDPDARNDHSGRPTKKDRRQLDQFKKNSQNDT